MVTYGSFTNCNDTREVKLTCVYLYRFCWFMNIFFLLSCSMRCNQVIKSILLLLSLTSARCRASDREKEKAFSINVVTPSDVRSKRRRHIIAQTTLAEASKQAQVHRHPWRISVQCDGPNPMNEVTHTLNTL